MALILNIETSVSICSVNVARDGLCLYESIGATENDHIAQLTSLTIEALKNTDNKLSNLDAVAISAGPGSYTGLRIGVSTAKGFCHAINKPLLAISTLQSMVSPLLSHYNDAETQFCPLIDARRLEVYTAIYSKDGLEVLAPQPLILEEGSFDKFLDKNNVVFFGSGLEKSKPYLRHPRSFFFDAHQQLSSNMCALSYKHYVNEKFEDLGYYQPNYLKPYYSSKK